MRPIARVLDQVACPRCGVGVILSGSNTSFNEGRPIARVGDIHSLGGVILTGSIAELVDSRPVARVGDYISCHCRGVGRGLIISGSTSYLC